MVKACRPEASTGETPTQCRAAVRPIRLSADVQKICLIWRTTARNRIYT